MRSKQDAAAARAAAAQRDEARSRLSGLEVERQGYVARGDKDGVAAVDEEISKYKEIVGDDDGAEQVDLTGVEPEEVFRMFGVPDDVVATFAESIAAKTAVSQPAGGDTPADQAKTDGSADGGTTPEPTPSRRGRAKAAAKPEDTASGDGSGAGTGV